VGPGLEGSEFAGYRVGRLIGRGGMGVVYMARHASMGRVVALKLIAPELARDDSFRARFERESRLAAAIDHPNVLPIYEAGSEGESLYIAMRFVEGMDLRTLIRSEGPLDPARAGRIIAQVGTALDAAHVQGLVHRDVKPANVLIGPGDHAYLTDFGLTRRVDIRGFTDSGQFVGTFNYASPEQVQGDTPGPAADVYSLGCVLYEALTGVVPFPRENEGATAVAHVNDPPPIPSAIAPACPVELDLVVQRAMAKRPDQRFATAGELGSASVAAASGVPLAGVVEVGTDSGAATSPPAVRTPPEALRAPTRAGARVDWRGHRRFLTLASVAVVAAIATAVVLVVSGSGETATEIAFLGQPGEIAVDQSGVWVTDTENSEIVRIDPASNAVAGTPTRVPSIPEDVVVDRGSVWVASSTGTLTRLDARDTSRSDELAVGGHPFAVAAGAGAVWVVDSQRARVIRVDSSRLRITAVTRVRPHPKDVAADGGEVWVALARGAQRLDPDSGKPDEPLVRTTSPLESISIGDGRVWATSLLDDSAFIVDPISNEQPTPIDAGAGPEGVAVGNGSAWITSHRSDEVLRFDAASGSPEGGPLPVGETPVGIAVGEGAIWVANYDGRSLTRLEP
jgi:streptogramin lyase